MMPGQSIFGLPLAGVEIIIVVDNWTDEGTYLRPNDDGDQVRARDSGGTKTIRIYHDGTDAVIETDSGNIRLKDAVANDKTLAQLISDIASKADAAHNHNASNINAGTLADARVAESNVTQHEGAITISESQISDLKAYLLNLADDLTPQLGGELDAGENSIGFTEKNNTGTEIDWTKSNKQKKTLTANTTLTFVNPSKPCNLLLRIIQDATGGRTLTLPTIKWAGGSAPSFSTGANDIDLLLLYFDGTSYYGQVVLDLS